MHATLPLLVETNFPALQPHALDTLQVDPGRQGGSGGGAL